ncbi:MULTISPECIES: hypothetical protein [Aeribacillus]|jgi:hypothetical protein|uniref:hypothetical protein n=1 Tax=Aeribacillus TaxID=1055323 RepID=UPI002E1E595C|nr:hypothetical protein [Aeribacillus composti]
MILKQLIIRVLMCVAVILNFIPNSSTTYVFTTLIFIGYLAYYFIIETRYFIIYFIVFFSILSNLLSTLLLETQNVYLYELGTISFYAGSFKYAFLIFVITNEFLYFFYKKERIKFNSLELKDPANKNINFIDRLMLIVYLVLLGYFILNIVDKPFWVVNVGKFGYEKEVFSANPLLGNIKVILMYYSVYLGYMFYRTKNATFILLFLLSVLSYFWIGQKFSSILFMSLYFIFPFLLKMNIKKIRKVTLRVGIMVLLILFVNRILFVNSSMNKVENDITQYFYNRLAQQNQLWWYFYSHRDEYRNKNKVDEIIEDIRYSNENVDNIKKIKSGEFKLIDIAAGRNMALARAQLNAPFATGVHSQVLYYSGSIIIVLLYVILWAFFYNKITFIFFKLLGNHTFLASPLLVLFAKIYKMSFEIGFQIVNRIFQITNIMTLILIIIVFTISRMLDDKKRRFGVALLPPLRSKRQ